MKRITFIILFFLVSFIVFSQSGEKKNYESFNLGASCALGGRYDQVRMCVASPAGFPGGVAFEFMGVVGEYRFHKFFGVGVYIPMARPILFGAAFRMLQFLPESVFSFHIPITEKVEFLLNAGFGASFHYGPDLNSDLNNKGPSFAAAGPRISLLAGPQFILKEHFILIVGLKPYFEYLFARELNGAVVGAEIDFQFRYSFKINRK